MTSQYSTPSAIEKRATLQVQQDTQTKVTLDDETTESRETESPQTTTKRNVTPEVESISSPQSGTTKAVQPPVVGAVLKPMANDILSGRGAGVNLHPGNVYFRSLIQSNKQSYIDADPGEKKRIIKRIVEIVIKRGRFLKQDSKAEMWIPITIDEARRKTGQALRENAPAIKKQRNDIKQKLQMARQIKNVLPNYLPSRKETEPVSLAPRASPPVTSSFASPIISANATNLLWSRMNALQEKQEQLKRKQRELEDEQHQLMQCFYQISASVATPLSLGPMDLLFRAASSDSGSDSEVDQRYTHSQKKRRIIVQGH